MKQLYLTLLFFTFSAVLVFAQIEIDIADGMTVETTGSLYISGVADVNENTTGYLKGTVESSPLSGATEFAGLTLGTPFSGTITRTTGTAFSSSTPKTVLRNYELNASSPITADVDARIVTATTNNEENGIVDKFIFKEQSSTWTGYTDNGSTASNIKAAGVNIPSGVSNITVAEGLGVGARIFLEGPYQGGGTPMTNTLTLPSASPYTEASRTATPPAGAVDWVLVELRNGTAAATSVGYRSAFVNQQGYLINDDGTQGIGFPTVPNPSGHYLVVKHRNHLSVMSDLTQTYNWYSE